MKRYLLLILFFLACNRTGPESVLARVGTKTITREEFLQRAEWSPALNYKGPDSARADYLLNLLINEKLAALAAAEAGLDTSAAIRQLTGFIEDLALARELYRREVQRNVQLDEEEMERAVRHQAQTRTIAYLVFDDEKLARRYQERLTAGLSFNAALRDLYGMAADTMANRREIKWGFNESAIEDVVYTLKPGDVSPVVAVEGAFMVMILEEVRREPVVPEAEQARWRHLARRILRGRKEAVISDQFVAALALEKKLQFNKPLLQTAADFMAQQSQGKKANDTKIDPGGHPLDAEVFQASHHSLRSQMDAPLVSWSDGQVTLRQMLEKWQGCNFNVDQTSAASCRRSIVRGFSLLARDALLASESRKRGYDKLPGVRNDAAMWQDYYLCAALQRQLTKKNVEQTFSWQPYLQQWRARYRVQVDSIQLQRTEHIPVPVLALRIGQYNALVAPPWTDFQ